MMFRVKATRKHVNNFTSYQKKKRKSSHVTKTYQLRKEVQQKVTCMYFLSLKYLQQKEINIAIL